MAFQGAVIDTPVNDWLIRFDRDTPELASTYDRASDRQFEHGKILLADLAIQPGERVLDIGAGTGRLAEYAAELAGPAGRVVAVDPLPLRVSMAARRAGGRFDTRVARAEALDQFADASFDVVFLNSVFHWVADKPRALAECYRVLKPGGRFGLNCQDPDHPHETRICIARAVRAAGLPFSPAEVHPYAAVTAVALKTLVEAAGFSNYAARLVSISDPYPDAAAVLEFSSSSSFGNSLGVLNNGQRLALRDELAKVLGQPHAADGYTLARHLNFVIARKPALG